MEQRNDQAEIGPIADDRLVKVTLELPASLHRDLMFLTMYAT
ncbi:DUF2274 domain-containing protein [Aminobacter sp. UC22_36]